MKIGTLQTTYIQDHDGVHDEAGAIGHFTLDVYIDDEFLFSTADRWEAIRYTISQHFAQVVMDTKVPSEYWQIKFTPEVAMKFYFPAALKFGA